MNVLLLANAFDTIYYCVSGVTVPVEVEVEVEDGLLDAAV